MLYEISLKLTFKNIIELYFEILSKDIILNFI